MALRPASPRPALSRSAVVVAGVLCAALLTACSGGPDEPTDPTPSDAASASPSDTPSDTASTDAGAEETDGTASPDETLTAQQACAAMYVDGGEPLERRVVAALVGISEDGAGTDTVGTMTAVGIELGSLSVTVPTEFEGAVEKVRVPFLQLQENLDTGTEESVDLDIASAREGLTEYRELCDAAGETSTS
ncbi:hypothetical protein V5D56_07385 [Cellulosimicrobium sp. PMB13]|uniref:hypothetical protein n=1 Tax=Cellulosimicrobium sp. PMB13 TaxID=3120158 RepID=UPI003F4C03C1